MKEKNQKVVILTGDNIVWAEKYRTVYDITEKQDYRVGYTKINNLTFYVKQFSNSLTQEWYGHIALGYDIKYDSYRHKPIEMSILL